MAVNRIVAQATVSDLDNAERWYAALWGRGPDVRPMPGLLEWHLGGATGLQMWSEPARAGHSTVMFGSNDLDADSVRLAAAGISHDGMQPGGDGLVLSIVDPDGNRVVFTS